MRALCIFLAAVAGCAKEPAEDGSKGTFEVKRGPLKITLTERGTLKTKKSTEIRAETNAKIEWIVDEGKEVKKDDILVELDKKDHETQLEQFVNQITQVEAELKSAITEETIQIDQNKTDIEKAELNLQVKRVELEKLLESDIPSKERELLLDIEKKKTDLNRAEDQLRASAELLKEEFVSELDHEDAKLKLREAKNALQTSEIKHESYLKYDKPLDIKQKTSAVTEAERALERAKKRAEAQLASKSAHVQQKRVMLKRLTVQRDKKQEELEKMTLKAPTDGTVLYGDPDNPWNNERIKVGGQVWNNFVIITLPDPSEMAVTIQVHEADINKIKTGLKAFVWSETQRDTVYDGEITKIDTVANAGRRWWGGDDVKRFKVEVSLKGEEFTLKPGTSARVEVLVEEIPDVVQVPSQAVFAKEGSYYCYKQNGSGLPERVGVEPGRANETFLEIKSGLAEGDTVLLYDPDSAEADAAAATETAAPEGSGS